MLFRNNNITKMTTVFVGGDTDFSGRRTLKTKKLPEATNTAAEFVYLNTARSSPQL